MVTVTENAKGLLKEVLTAHSSNRELGVRLVVNPGRQQGLGLALGREEDGDQVIEYGGFKVLLVSRDMASRVDRVTLDMDDTPDGLKLLIQKN